jgi:hypothetical protein
MRGCIQHMNLTDIFLILFLYYDYTLVNVLCFLYLFMNVFIHGTNF